MQSSLPLHGSLLLLSALFASCASTALYRAEGEVPRLIQSKLITSKDVTPITSAAFPSSDETDPVVIDDSTVIFVSDNNNNLDIFQMDYGKSNGSGQVEIIATENDEKAPVVIEATDGAGEVQRRCVYVSNASSKFEVYAGDLPRVQIQSTVFRPTRHANWPSFDSSQERMLFSSLDRRGRYQTWLQDANGVKLVADEGQRAHWNPRDSNVFVYTAKNGEDWQIFEKSVTTGKMKKLTTGTKDNFDPRYSPDGLHIAFTSNRQGSSDIWIMEADGSNPQQITEHGAADCMPDWSPDGRWLIFVSNRGESLDLWKVSSGIVVDQT